MRRQSDILLESGTNELEIMEFSVSGKLFGINVAKVQEIMKVQSVNSMQKSHPDIEGVFKPRDVVITVVDLAHHLGLGKSENPEFDIFIITNFSKETYAFHVHEVVGINRISWENLKKPDDIIYGGDEGVATAITAFEGRLITILDFEKIIREISPRTGINLEEVHVQEENQVPLLVAEDSMLLRNLLEQGLDKAGYKNVTFTKHGLEAWEYLNNMRANGYKPDDFVRMIITDIEMPHMDGHHLIKRVREDEDFRHIPIVIFSSLINEQSKLKGEDLGATGQFSKPELSELIHFVDGVLFNNQ